MGLPGFNSEGDLPAGVYQASPEEIVERFGDGSRQRRLVTTRLTKISELARRTGMLERFIIFGSYAIS